LHGGEAGSRASDLDETITVLNLSNAPVDLHLFAYSDFDLANIPGFDSISLPSVGVMVQQGKGTMVTETVQSPLPTHWQTEFYAGLVNALDGGIPVTLADTFNPPATGDQTFGFQWDAPLGVGQRVAVALTRSIRPVFVPLTITLAGTDVVISWPASAGPGFNLTSSDVIARGSAWATVTNVQEIVGAKYQVVVPRASGAHYYRLER
jgi:hypothetical protein